METRAQKRKRESEQNWKEKSKQNKISRIAKNIEKESTDITMKHNMKHRKLLVRLDRIELKDCKRNHEHNALRINSAEEHLIECNESRKKVTKSNSISDAYSCRSREKVGSSCSFNQNDFDKMTSENQSHARKRKRGDDNNVAVESKVARIRTKRWNKESAAASVNKPRTVKTNNKNSRKKNELRMEEWIESVAPKNVFMENEIVLATIPGYVPWPARILSINSETIFVEFFGTGQINPVRSGALTRFDLNKVMPLLQRKGYKKAIRELEMILSIPNDVSIMH